MLVACLAQRRAGAALSSASIEVFAANGHRPGVRIISERDRRIMIVLPMDQFALTLESQPLAPGSWLAETLSDVVMGAENVAYDNDDGFIATVSALLAARQTGRPKPPRPHASATGVLFCTEGSAASPALLLRAGSHRRRRRHHQVRLTAAPSNCRPDSATKYSAAQRDRQYAAFVVT